MTLHGLGYEVDYYSVSAFNYPVVVFRGFMNGEPVFFTVSLFAMAPSRIYTVGYYSGYGSVAVNLTGSLVRYIASRWLEEFNGALNPSLIAFITYGEGNKTWTVITAIPYKPSWVVSQEPIEITVNANFTAVRPVIAVPMTKPTGTTQSDSTNGLGSDPFGYTYVGSCMGNANVYPPPPPQSPPSCGKYGTQCYYWALQQCSAFEGPIPLFFVGWSQNAIQSISGIFIDYMGGGTAQSGSGLFGTLNDSGALVLVGPTITFSQTYTIETPIGSQVCIAYGPSLTFTGGNCPGINIPSPIYYVPSSGFFYIGLPGNVSYVAFQEYEGGYGPLDNWANGTEPLSLLPQDFFDNNYLLVYPYIDVGNGSITGMFAEVLHAYEMRRQLVVSLDDGYNSVANVSACPSPLYGYQELTGNLAFVEYTLGNAITAYSPRPVNIAPLLESLLPGVYVGEVPTIVGHLITGAGTVSTIAGAFIDTNHLLIGANVYVNFNPSSSSSFYITLIGSPQATNPGGSSSIYPMGMIINASNYYLGLRECER
ncbi:hypothetical protein B7L70_00540 [Vulcanisaeta sp. EB80]|nr:hypothetical protein B7L70_00540 [Vulcanisaeta sp. EB80]